MCEQFLDNGDDKRLRPALEYISKIKMDWDAKGSLLLYGWYYMTQAMFQAGRSYWPAWNRQMQPLLLKTQHDDGFWNAPEGTTNHELALGPVYSTALCTLTLEVYYRYLPLYTMAGRPGRGSQHD